MKKLVEVRHVSKKYRLPSGGGTHRTLKGAIQSLLSGQWKREAGESLWALRDVTFSLDRGDVVAVLGHNGSGKSTLLKLISRITDPTEGKITLYGHLGALLEVGTGMHPDLTGRD